MTVKYAVGILISLAAVAAPAAAQLWIPAKCDIKPGHSLVNEGVKHLKSASETKFADQRQRDLKEADRVLTQAVTTGGQDKNPAAWYYLGRYYALRDDITGADSALAKAGALAPQCQQEIAAWRRIFWVPLFNGGVQAWQAGNTDSAIASFRRANQIYDGEPSGFIYLGTLFASANQTDSAAKYFRLAVPAARDTQYARDKRDALFNVARVYHGAERWDDAGAAYKDYLAAYPSDVQAMAGLASVYAQQSKPDEAQALHAQILDHADSAEANDLFYAAQAILNGIPAEPDTAPLGAKCRTATRAKNKTLTVRQVAARCGAATDSAIKDYRASIAPRYRLAARAYEAGLARNPYMRDALYNLGGVYYLLGDSLKVLPVAQRLRDVDPLNRTTLAKLAGAWQLQGNKDSTLRYLQVADSLSLEVTVSGFAPRDSSVTLNGLFTNLKAQPTTPASVTFEFLGPKGDVVTSQQQDVPPLDPSSNRAFEIKTKGAGIVAWRYRKS